MDKRCPVSIVDDCEEPFESLPAPTTRHEPDESAICKLKQTQGAMRWFFGTSLGREVLASLTWRTFADSGDVSHLQPVGPVLRVDAQAAGDATFVMPLRWSRRGDEGKLFLLLRGLRMAPGRDSLSEDRDDTRVEWAIISRDPAKPLSCTTAFLREALRVIEQQMRNTPGQLSKSTSALDYAEAP